MTGKGQTAVSGMKKLDDVHDAQDWQTVNLNFVLTSKVRSVTFFVGGTNTARFSNEDTALRR